MRLVWTLAFAVAGGALIWCLQPKRRRWRSLFDETPGGMTSEEFEQRRRRRYLFRRFLVSALSAGVMAAAAYVGWALVMH